MLLKEYIDCCKEFAEDTKNWGKLNQYNFYTTNGLCWNESCDNNHGGLDISWAFHKTSEYIEQEAPQIFINIFTDQVSQGIDEQIDESQWNILLKNFKQKNQEVKNGSKI